MQSSMFNEATVQYI